MTDATDIVNTRTLDLSPFASASRKLDADAAAWIETTYILAELQRNSWLPMPQNVLDHLRARLEGTAKKRQGG